MSDYIKREDLKEDILEWATLLTNPKYLDKSATLDIINQIPSADVAEVRHGYPVYHNRPAHCYKLQNNPSAYCSECGRRLHLKIDNYCPNCGARMDKEENQ